MPKQNFDCILISIFNIPSKLMMTQIKFGASILISIFNIPSKRTLTYSKTTGGILISIFNIPSKQLSKN